MRREKQYVRKSSRRCILESRLPQAAHALPLLLQLPAVCRCCTSHAGNADTAPFLFLQRFLSCFCSRGRARKCSMPRGLCDARASHLLCQQWVGGIHKLCHYCCCKHQACSLIRSLLFEWKMKKTLEKASLALALIPYVSATSLL